MRIIFLQIAIWEQIWLSMQYSFKDIQETKNTNFGNHIVYGYTTYICNILNTYLRIHKRFHIIMKINFSEAFKYSNWEFICKEIALWILDMWIDVGKVYINDMKFDIIIWIFYVMKYFGIFTNFETSALSCTLMIGWFNKFDNSVRNVTAFKGN